MKKIILSLVIFLSCIYADKVIIGKYERVTFNNFNINEIRAKIDTGAKTSSLHCSMIKQVDDNRVAFIVLDSEHKKFQPKTHTAKISRIAHVKSSNGTIQERYFINTSITLLGKEYLTEFSLTNRGNMKFPVLLGRSLLQENFLVDVTQEYVGDIKK